jgi:hypothetical protein
MDLFEGFITGFYLPRKAAWSREIDAKVKNSHAPLPVLGKAGADGRLSKQVIEAINSQCGKLQYTSDPLGGLADFYNHPELSQWRLNNKRWDQPCDCDDFAVYAVALARACGTAQDKAWVWNLIITPGNQISQAWANHVIAGFELWDGTKLWTAIIDTNSASRNQVSWFQGDRQQTQAAILAHFNAVYKVSYYKLLAVPYPF